MIPDTSRQDVALAPDTKRARLRLAAIAAVVVAALALAAWSAMRWQGSTQAVNAAKLRIAPVQRGTLVRDAAVAGRVVAAVSPTLYAAAPGTVNLQVNAGDSVKKGDVLAELESPELANALQREQSTTQELEAEIARQQIIARKQKLLAVRDADQAEIERAAAQRQLEPFCPGAPARG